MSAVCPNGHTSEATDYCDICGSPIAEGAVTPEAEGSPAPASASPNSLDLPPAGGSTDPAAAPSEAGPAAEAGPASAPDGPKECPNCHTPNTPDSLFCEACGYDFTTGALPAGMPANATEAEPTAESPVEAGPLSTPEATGVPPRIAFEWVAEVWIDPDWYADQQATEPLPSPGLPVIVPLRVASALVGRKSTSRNIVPDIDCSADPGVSRRHAQLTTDGSRWFVEDLQSSNGTFVGPASGPLPDDPIAVGPKTEVADNRIYVGAWTRIVVRRATDEEIAIG